MKMAILPIVNFWHFWFRVNFMTFLGFYDAWEPCNRPGDNATFSAFRAHFKSLRHNQIENQKSGEMQVHRFLKYRFNKLSTMFVRRKDYSKEWYTKIFMKKEKKQH